MENRAAQQAVQAILDSCRESLGQDLKAAYLFGSLASGTFVPGESDINLLLVLAHQSDLHKLRRAYGPVWLRHRDILGQSPVVLLQPALGRYLHLNPVLAQHLRERGRLLAGRDGLEQVPAPATFEPLSQLAGQIMAASASLAPQMLQPADGQRRLAQLRRLFRQTTGQPAPSGAPATMLVGQLLQDLERQITDALARQPVDFVDRPGSAPPPDAPALVPQLLAIYEIEDRLILVLPDQPEPNLVDLIDHVNWPAVADSVGQHYCCLHVVTASQLRLFLYYEAPAAHLFGRYAHAWGANLLSDLNIAAPLVLRDLGRRPAEIGAVTLPHAYLTADDAELPKLIHDLQNRLLNIQLQQELFSRIGSQPRVSPIEPLPGRETALDQRIDTIVSQLDWWSDYYFNALQPAACQPVK
jgi:hypothetical protein